MAAASVAASAPPADASHLHIRGELASDAQLPGEEVQS
jgi:hypothetical protein